jgi:hypothetical protein
MARELRRGGGRVGTEKNGEFVGCSGFMVVFLFFFFFMMLNQCTQ